MLTGPLWFMCSFLHQSLWLGAYCLEESGLVMRSLLEPRAGSHKCFTQVTQEQGAMIKWRATCSLGRHDCSCPIKGWQSPLEAMIQAAQKEDSLSMWWGARTGSPVYPYVSSSPWSQKLKKAGCRSWPPLHSPCSLARYRFVWIAFHGVHVVTSVLAKSL